MFRRRRRQQDVALAPPPEPVLEPPWRTAVDDAVASQARFRALVEQSPPGPVRERLSGLDERLDGGVAAAHQIALSAQAAARTLDAMGLERVQGRLKDARRRLAQAHAAGAVADARSLEAEVSVLAEQHTALNQLANGLDESAERLRLLDLRLQATVARAAQIVLRPDAATQLGTVEDELEAVTDELVALRAGLDAVDGTN